LETLRREILERAGEVARASGGVLGFGERVSPAEQAVLTQLAQAFVEAPESLRRDNPADHAQAC
jgi:hypothetical protein